MELGRANLDVFAETVLARSPGPLMYWWSPATRGSGKLTQFCETGSDQIGNSALPNKM